MTFAAVHHYLVALVDGGGTVPPELGAVRRLVERGHHVVVLAEDSTEDEVRATGATFRRWATAPNRASRRAEHDPYRDWECKNPRKLFRRLMDLQFIGPAPRYVADVQAAVAERRPDAILCTQFALGAMVAAEAEGIPFHVLMPNTYLLPTPGMPPFGMGLSPARGPLGRLRDWAVTTLVTRMWDEGTPLLNELRASLGLEPVRGVFEQIHRAARHVVMTSAAFDFPAELPAHARYVGPVLDDPSWSERWTPPPGTDPLVLVALSSTFQDQVETIQRIVDALASSPVRGVVTTGPALDPSSVRGADNVSVVPSAPHTEVLRHASVVITHGGHGTVVKSLAAGVPVVILPHGRDQGDNAARVVARGAGIRLRRSASPRRIAGAVRRLLEDDAYREAAGRLGAALRADAESGALVRELEDLATVPATC